MTATLPEPAAGRPYRVLRAAARAAWHVVRYELRIWLSLARWIARRPYVPAGGAAHAHRGPVVAPLLAFFGVSVVELFVVDLLVRPWPAVRIALLAVGTWGSLWMLGLLAGITVRPHATGPDGLYVRNGLTLDARIPWDAVAGARALRGGRDGRAVQCAGRELDVSVSHQTTVEITLNRPVLLPLPARAGGPAEVSVVRLYADDPAALVAAVEARTAAAAAA